MTSVNLSLSPLKMIKHVPVLSNIILYFLFCVSNFKTFLSQFLLKLVVFVIRVSVENRDKLF